MATMANDIKDHAATRQPTIKVTARHDRSFMVMLLQTFIRPFNQRLVSHSKEYPAGSPQLPPHRKAKKKLDISERKVDDVYLYRLSPKHSPSNEKNTRKRRLYYFAGGGWQMPASSEHWSFLTELCLNLPETAITLVSYPLAPHSPAPIAFPMLMRLYRTLMQDAANANEEVILAGDSAGGNIALALVIAALAEDAASATCPPCPAAILALSPSTDMRRSNPTMKEIEKLDPLLRIPFAHSTAAAWCGETSQECQAWERSDVRVSPLLADLGPLAKRGVKVHGVTGRYDILSPDAVLFREKCEEAGVEGEWLDWDKQIHVFPLIFSFGFREGIEAKDWILEVLRRT
ncbi:Esterase [Fulvia fulva]|uniref:Esterase n=1 Tax=Passalora fulva TaxID=5499 RepID=A0A9Q8PAF7_PASFU|nr:Esterase [Fulvia fulva]KAK4622087.1 Esterase [Fulvia fulva]KAK4623401.1 Esterase [Fulvia fulva]UJO18875.1 Esterase [Fulvia fulva]WPV15673.1 Esterase [Fulvia fulva]WPV31465.1 Esterase [Fulvia fulva]